MKHNHWVAKHLTACETSSTGSSQTVLYFLHNLKEAHVLFTTLSPYLQGMLHTCGTVGS